MEILSPSPPPSPSPYPAADDQFRLRYGSRLEDEACVHVAVGRSPEKTLALLRWALRRFGSGRRIALLHVHQPSPVIPTLLGKIPAGQATEELVLSHRRSEKEETNKILLGYLAFCHRAQVQATLLVTENDQIHDGILTLITHYGITNLVMGSTPDNCFKLKASYGKESLMARNAPPFCEIWFVWRGRHIWTREATGNDTPQDEFVTTKRIRFTSYGNNAEHILDQGYTAQGIASDCDPFIDHQTIEPNHFYNMTITNWQDAEESALSSTFWSSSSLHMETLQLHSKEMLDKNLKQVMMGTEVSRKDAFVELLKRKETESKVTSAFSRVKASETTEKHEIKMREELEGLLQGTRKQHEDLINNKEKAAAGLEFSMSRLDILDDRAKKICIRMDEVAAELEVIQSSIATLRKETAKMQNLENRHSDHIEGSAHATLPVCMSNAFDGDSYSFEEFTLSDMESATCKFAETFKIQSGIHGWFYKGEILDKRVMIYKLQSCSIQSVRQFQQEVCIRSKVRHPHLLTLVGACPEALCLVYEYLPNSLHDSLFSRCNSLQLPWKIRARIIAEISGALLFLHSCKPEMIIHGNLNLKNILLDADFHCKIADVGISWIRSDGMEGHPSCSAGSELKAPFPSTDPEYQRTQVLTPMSDIYYFGIVILQLLTGKQEPVTLASEVRRALSCGKLSSVLDPTAGEWPAEVAGRLAEFGIRCSEASSQNRSELTPGTLRDLEQLHLVKERHISSSFVCPILQEVMHDPQVCADGSTYEGRAIREWMESGRVTSPLTGQKLDHRDLTPNHALRFAIQDWLSHSHHPWLRKL